MGNINVNLVIRLHVVKVSKVLGAAKMASVAARTLIGTKIL